MTTQADFLKNIISALDQAHIPYMLSGSISSSFHGHPRATNDADLILDPTEKQLLTFINSLGPDYYLIKDTALQALKDRSMFNIIGIQSGWKADLIIRKKRPFSKIEFDRRINAKIMGIDLWTLTPEDAILSKLEWSQAAQSQRQFQDALGIAIVQAQNLDLDYLRQWARQLNLSDSLEKLLQQAQQK